MADPLTLCKLVSFNPDGTVYDQVDFLGDVFFDGANIAFAAPPSSRRQQWGGGNVYKPGEHLRENTYENGAISITPTVWIDKIPADSCRQGMECLRLQLMGMFEDARLYEQHQQDSGKKVCLYDDHKGFDIESQIIDGWVEGLDDLDAYIIDQGVAHFTVTMTRKPFRYAAWVNGWGEEGERLENMVFEPSYLQDHNADGLADNWWELNPPDVTPTLIATDYVTGGQSQRVQTVVDAVNDTGIRTTQEGVWPAIGADATGTAIVVTAQTEYYLSWFLHHVSGDRVTLRVMDDVGLAAIAGARLQWDNAADGGRWEEKEMMFTTPIACTRISIHIVVEAADSTGATDFYADKGYVTDRRNLITTTISRVGWASNNQLEAHWDEDGLHNIARDNQSHTNLLDVEDVYGDIPIKPRIWLYNTINLVALKAGHTLGSRFTRPWEMNHWGETDAVANADSSNADSSANIAVADSVWTSLCDRIWPIVDVGWIVAGDPSLGSYLAFTLMGCAAIPNDFYIRAAYGLRYDVGGGVRGWAGPVQYTDAIYINQTVAAGMTNWPCLGSIRFPRKDFDRAGIQPEYLRVDVEVWQTSGAPLNFLIDFICVVPTEGGVSRSLQPTAQGISLIILEPDDTAHGAYAPGATYYTWGWNQTGETPTLNHKGPTRLVFQPYGYTDMANDNVGARVPTKVDWRPTFL